MLVLGGLPLRIKAGPIDRMLALDFAKTKYEFMWPAQQNA
jgi:hypothetical protein